MNDRFMGSRARRVTLERHRTRWPVAVLAVLALLAAACGDDDDAGSDISVGTGGDATTTVAEGDATTVAGGDATTTAATGGDTTGEDATAAAEDVDPNGKLTVATNFQIGGEYRIDPALGCSVSWEGIGYLIFGTPLKLDRDGTVAPYLAESYEIPDPQTFKLTLREGLTFQDGQPYTAEVMKQAIEVKLASRNDTNSNYRTGPGTRITGITADSPTELTFTMDGPVAGLMPYVMTTSWGHVPAPGYDPELPTGAGPYKPVAWEPNVSLRLEKWDDFFMADEFLLKEIEFVNLPAPEAASNALRSGAVDFIATSPDQVEGLEAAGFQSVVTNNEAHYNIILCETAPPFDNPQFREAFRLGIDQNTVNDLVMAGRAEPLEGMWPAGSPFGIEGVADPAGDKERARQILDEIGMADTTVRIAHYNVPTHLRILEVVQAQVAEVGINVEVVPIEPGTQAHSVINDDTGGGWVVAQANPGIVKIVQLDTEGSAWDACGDEPQPWDDLIAQIVAGELEGQELEDAMKEIQTGLVENTLVIPILSQPASYVFNERVGGVQEGTVGLTAATAPGPFFEGIYIKQ